MKILTVCGMGSGSSLILKMNIEKILGEMNIKADVETSDLGSAKGQQADLIISTIDLKRQLEDFNVPKIFLNNILDMNTIKKELQDFFDSNI